MVEEGRDPGENYLSFSTFPRPRQFPVSIYCERQRCNVETISRFGLLACAGELVVLVKIRVSEISRAGKASGKWDNKQQGEYSEIVQVHGKGFKKIVLAHRNFKPAKVM